MNAGRLSVLLAGLMLSAGCVSLSEFHKQQAQTTNCLADVSKCSSDKQALQAQVDALSKEKAALAEAEKAKEAEIAQLKGTYDQLVGSLKNEIADGEIQVTQLKDKLTLNLVEKILFASGQTQIRETGTKVLDRIGEVLKKVQDKDIRVEGHTDNVPVGPRLRERYPTNWELSTTRATNVVRYLQDKAGVDPSHLIAAGYGEYHPVAPNDTPQGHAQNRRIEIVLVAREMSSPPQNAAPQPQAQPAIPVPVPPSPQNAAPPTQVQPVGPLIMPASPAPK